MNIKNVTIKLTFNKEERLCSKKQIDFLFRVGQHFTSHPIKIVFTQSTIAQKYPVKAMFVVPKKNIRKANDRNKLKRRMKEVYRQNKYTLYTSEPLESKKLLLCFIYIGKEEKSYLEILESMLALQKRLMGFTFKTN